MTMMNCCALLFKSFMKITIIGTGNVAFHLGKRFKEKHIKIAQIVGRNAEKAAQLAQVLDADFTMDFNEINTKSDLYIIAVSDSAIPSVAEALSQSIDNQLVVHTSGSMPSTILQPYFTHFGILYPLQTFSINSYPDFDKIPIFINASTSLPKNTEDSQNSAQQPIDFLRQIALKLSPNIYELSDEKRVIVHIAAVIVNNFTNHLYAIGEEILKKEGLPFDVLKPLIVETVRKVQQNSPRDMQTGPARRGDAVTLEKHLDYLKKQTPQYFDLYKLISESITHFPFSIINCPL